MKNSFCLVLKLGKYARERSGAEPWRRGQDWLAVQAFGSTLTTNSAKGVEENTQAFGFGGVLKAKWKKEIQNI